MEQFRECTFKVGPEENQRMAALRATDILDSNQEECFDRITSLLSRVLECPIALVSFVDAERQWFKVEWCSLSSISLALFILIVYYPSLISER
jgi:hypothetical protein